MLNNPLALGTPLRFYFVTVDGLRERSHLLHYVKCRCALWVVMMKTGLKIGVTNGRTGNLLMVYFSLYLRTRDKAINQVI